MGGKNKKGHKGGEQPFAGDAGDDQQQQQNDRDERPAATADPGQTPMVPMVPSDAPAESTSNGTGERSGAAAAAGSEFNRPTESASPSNQRASDERTPARPPPQSSEASSSAARGGGSRIQNYGSISETPAPRGQANAPPPTPATAYKGPRESEEGAGGRAPAAKTTVMRHHSGVIVDRDASSQLLSKSGFSGGSSGKGDDNDSEGDYRLTTMIKHVFLDKYLMKLLMLAAPVALFGQGYVSNDIVFFASFLGLIPFAALLGDFTEDLALRSNDVVGALFNVTFGNATELIISIMALRAGMIDVIKLSLIGSVLGNMLLVLGTAFLLGGLKYKDMTFNSDAVNTYAPLLMLSMMGFVIPSAYWASTSPNEFHSGRHGVDVILAVSRQIAVVMAISYIGYLFFQLRTHKHLFDAHGTPQIANPLSPTSAEREEMEEAEEEEEEEEETPNFTFMFALIGLAVASIIISFLSDCLVDTLTDAAEAWNLPKQFIGIILVPIVGNAAEHASAIFMAARNKLDISVGVALGSSIQIAMFVMPVLVIIGWIVGVPLDMDFHPFLTITTTLAVIVVQNITSDGKTNWLEGLLLICAYVMIALMFWNGSVKMEELQMTPQTGKNGKA